MNSYRSDGVNCDPVGDDGEGADASEEAQESIDKEVEADSGDGWTKVKKNDGTKGLVPTNFLKGRRSI